MTTTWIKQTLNKLLVYLLTEESAYLLTEEGGKIILFDGSFSLSTKNTSTYTLTTKN